MTQVTMDLIKKLREKTQVGMMDCKKALIESNGDIEKAIELLRKKGASVAARRAEHAINEGIIASLIAPDFRTGTLIEIGCETDFAANTDAVKQFTQNLLDHIDHTPKKTDSIEQLLAQSFIQNTSLTIQELLDELTAKISERITIAKVAHFTTDEQGVIQSYIHPGAHLGVMVELKTDERKNNAKEIMCTLAKDICMQIAVTDPLAITPEQLDAETIEKERAIAKEQLLSANKPTHMFDKIIEGKLSKFYQEACLLNQPFIKNDKLSVAQHIEMASKKIDSHITVIRFVRFCIGKK